MKARGRGLSRWGYTGLALFAVHVVLLFFPPIPPDVKGSLWWYLSAYVAVALLLFETGRRPWMLVEGWLSAATGRRWTLGLGVTIGTLVLAVVLRPLAPVLYGRFQLEAGLFEPVTLYCYLGAAVLVYGSARELEGRAQRHWRFVAALYVLLGLEEIDYLGVFGGLVGRVRGVYVGSAHDLVLLAAEGMLSPAVVTVILLTIALVVVLLLWSGYLQPRFILEMARSLEFLWVSVGLGFLFAAAAMEAQIFGWVLAVPTLEEALELCGAICFFCYALGCVAMTARPVSAASSRPT